MRFYTAIVALIAASAAAADFDLAKLVKSASGDCKADVSKYADCLIKPTSGDYKDRCEVIASETCQKFYGNPEKYLSTCIGSETVTSLIAADKVAVLNKEYTKACSKFKEAAKTTTTTTVTKTKTTTVAAAATDAAASAASSAVASVTSAAAAATDAAAAAATDAVASATSAAAAATDAVANAANNATAAANATLNNVVGAANNTAAANNNTANTSDATKITAASFLATLAFVMLSFY